MPPGQDIESADPQDRAETLDETNLTRDGDDIANFDDLPDVYDATAREDDGDIDDLDEARDEDEFDDQDIDLVAQGDDERDDEGLDVEGDDMTSDERNFQAADGEPRSFESESLSDKEKEALGYDDERKPAEHDPHVEDQLDHGLKETFPASDPVSINPGSD